MRILLTLFMALLLASCGSEQPDNVLQGYVEGRQVHLAPRANGIVTALYVTEGDQVVAGSVLFSVDSERAQAQLEKSFAAAAAAKARLTNLSKGGRPEEIRAAREALNETQANLTLAEQAYTRSKALVEGGVSAVARLDQDRAVLQVARARLSEAQSRLALILLPAREDLITAAQRDVEALNTAIARAELDLKDRSIPAPVSGRIETIYRRVGEVAGPTQPVLALLSPDQMRIRFFVPEPMLPRVHHGSIVSIHCDNCAHDLRGEVVYISNQAEFTPPIIFTEKERAKLVYLVEVRPDQPEQFLNGQPVHVTLP